MNPQSTSASSATTGSTTHSENAAGTPGSLAETKSKVTGTARETAAKLKSAAASTAAKARDQVAQIATEKKEAASERLGGYGSALHDSARTLEEQDPNIAWFAHRAADKLEGVADYMRTRDFQGLREDAEGVARRHPALFFGGMFVAGLLLGNVVKASRRKLEHNDNLLEGGRDAQGNWTSAPDDGDLAPSPELTAAERAAAGL